MEDELLREMQEWQSSFQPAPLTKLAAMGDGNGNLIPRDANGAIMPNTVWVRLADGALVKCKNYRCPNVYGLKVLVGYDPLEPRLFQVLQQRNSATAQDGQYPQVVAHGHTHRWMANPGGNDVAYIELRQFMPLRVAPAGGLTISIFSGVMWRPSGWRLVSPQSQDLSAYVPGGTNLARWVLVEFDGNGDVVLTAGATQDRLALTLSHCPPRTPGNIPEAAIRLYTGQTEIAETRSQTDIVDLRWSAIGDSSAPTGYPAENKSGGIIYAGQPVCVHSSGSGVVQAQADDVDTRAIGLARVELADGETGDIQTEDIFVLADWTSATGSATLTARGIYYLDSANPGKLTSTAPIAIGDVVQEVGRAISDTMLAINIQQIVLL